MAVDTVNLRLMDCSEEMAQQIERLGRQTSEVIGATGEVTSQVATYRPLGKWNASVSVKVFRQAYRPKRRDAGRRGPVGTALVPCAPWLEIAGSPHKLVAGHNISGGPETLTPACLWLIDLVSMDIQLPLPPASCWQLNRVDWTECYELDEKAIPEYVRRLTTLSYPRSRALIQVLTGVSIPGRATSTSVYHKGPEFRRHDRRRITRQAGKDTAESLQELANRTLRVENSLKAPKLKQHFGHPPTLTEVTDSYLLGEWEATVARNFKTSDTSWCGGLVSTPGTVVDRLSSIYSPHLASVLYRLWQELATSGEDIVRPCYAPSTYRRHLKHLRAAGISWINPEAALALRAEAEHGSRLDAGLTAAMTALAAYPDFQISLNDPRRASNELPEVAAALAPYRCK